MSEEQKEYNTKHFKIFNIKDLSIDSKNPYGKPPIDFLLVYKYWKMKNEFFHDFLNL